MRVLVTGAYGFIGGHILAALQEAGHQPVCAVRNPYGDIRFIALKSCTAALGRFY